MFFVKKRGFDNLSLSLKAKITSGEKIFIFFSDGGYKLILKDKLILERITGMAYKGETSLVSYNPLVRIEKEAWYKIKVSKDNYRIKVEINDKPVLSTIDRFGWSGEDIALGCEGGEIIFEDIELEKIEQKKGIGILHSPEDKTKLSHEFITDRASRNYIPAEPYWNDYYKIMFIEGSGGESFFEEYPGEDREDLSEGFTSRHFYNPDTGLGITFLILLYIIYHYIQRMNLKIGVPNKVAQIPTQPPQ